MVALLVCSAGKGPWLMQTSPWTASAVKDSLDCLAGIAASSQEGGQVCLESEASTAACFALQVCPRVNLAVAIALIQSMLLMLRRLTCPDIEAV